MDDGEKKKRLLDGMKVFFLKASSGLTCQELLQGLSVQVPALRVLDVVGDLEGLICFGSNHQPCE